MPTHHLPTEALLAYAAGTASSGQELLVACHLTVCPACREAAGRADVACAQALLPHRTPTSVDGSRERPPVPAELLARLDEADPTPPRARAPGALVVPPRTPASGDGSRERAPGDAVLPVPLTRRIGSFAALTWTPFLPGIRVHVVRELTTEDERVFLVDFRAGTRVPSHAHSGVERCLVLRGGYTVGGDAYARGDVSWREEDHDTILVDDDGPCTSFFVTDGRLQFGRSWLDALVDWRMMR